MGGNSEATFNLHNVYTWMLYNLIITVDKLGQSWAKLSTGLAKVKFGLVSFVLLFTSLV